MGVASRMMKGSTQKNRDSCYLDTAHGLGKLGGSQRQPPPIERKNKTNMKENT